MTDAEQPTRRSGILYVDTSALLKLIVREAESKAIEAELLRWEDIATSVVTEIELPRAVARAREDRPDNVIDGSVVLQSIIAAAMIVPLDSGIVSMALDVRPVHVGTLDAIHIGSASSLRPELAAVATYDKRMQDALGLMGIEVLAPGNAKLGPQDELEQPRTSPADWAISAQRTRSPNSKSAEASQARSRALIATAAIQSRLDGRRSGGYGSPPAPT